MGVYLYIGGLDGNQNHDIQSLCVLVHRAKKTMFSLRAKREKVVKIMKTREEYPHADSLLYSLHVNSRGWNSIS